MAINGLGILLTGFIMINSDDGTKLPPRCAPASFARLSESSESYLRTTITRFSLLDHCHTRFDHFIIEP